MLRCGELQEALTRRTYEDLWLLVLVMCGSALWTTLGHQWLGLEVMFYGSVGWLVLACVSWWQRHRIQRRSKEREGKVVL